MAGVSWDEGIEVRVLVGNAVKLIHEGACKVPADKDGGPGVVPAPPARKIVVVESPWRRFVGARLRPRSLGGQDTTTLYTI